MHVKCENPNILRKTNWIDTAIKLYELTLSSRCGHFWLFSVRILLVKFIDISFNPKTQCTQNMGKIPVKQIMLHRATTALGCQNWT